jgi:hypothetical protein
MTASLLKVTARGTPVYCCLLLPFSAYLCFFCLFLPFVASQKSGDEHMTSCNIGDNPIDRIKKHFHNRPQNRFPTNIRFVSIFKTTQTEAQKGRKGRKRQEKSAKVRKRQERQGEAGRGRKLLTV